MIFISIEEVTNAIPSCLCDLIGAKSCDWDQFDRPIGGNIDFCYETFKLNQHGQASEKVVREMVEIAIHEIGHILGLYSEDMAYYYDRTTGLPRTPRPLKISMDIDCVNGKKSSEIGYDVYAPSQDTLKFGTDYAGISYYEIVTPTVRQVAQNHFNCNRMNGMRLENQPTSNGEIITFRNSFIRIYLLC